MLPWKTTKTSNFTRQSKSFISIFFTCQVSACELQPFSCLDLANDTYSQTTKTVVSHLRQLQVNLEKICGTFTSLIVTTGTKLKTSKALNSAKHFSLMRIGTQLSVGRYSRPRFMDARLIPTPPYYGQFDLSLEKEIPYIFPFLNPLIRTPH